jgi:F0F1-type ATP synthase assembly protein I
VDYRFAYRRKKPGEHELAEEQRQERETVRRMRGLAIGLSIPMFLAAGPLGGWIIGALLDKWLGTSWLMPTLIILSTIAGFKMAIDMLLRLNKS